MPKNIDSAQHSDGVSSGARRTGAFNWTVSARNPLHKVCRALSTMPVAEYVKAVKQGVPMRLLGQLSEATACSVGQLAEMLGITRTTAYRMEREGEARTMKHFEGDAVADFARLVGEAQMDAGQARQALSVAAAGLMAWLELPSNALDGAAPAEMMSVGAGREQVLRMWKRRAAMPNASA